ncbi:MAG: hypothetical protein V4858_06375 [Pseudomonadota bacterium]
MTLPTELSGPFDVKTGDLLQIDPARAVELFRQLLVIEACKTGRPTTSINVPAAINVADGGIDAEVESLAGVSLPAGLIASGTTRYQIKTGAFSASTPSDIKSLLLRPKNASTTKPKREHLQPRVLSCFERGGTFVVVLFGSEVVGKSDDHGVSQIVAYMTRIDPAFSKINVRIIRANQLCTAIKTLAPGIALRLNRLGGNDDALLNAIEFLGESCGLEVDAYKPTEELDRVTGELTSVVNTLGKFRHVRVLGDAGAGKTHLIFRALSASRLEGCVLYCRAPEDLDGSAPLQALVEMSKDTTIVLFADECDLETASLLASRFKRRATNMLLVTANNEAEPSSSHTEVDVVEVAPLTRPTISEIFKSYGIPDETADWLAGLCEGSPRAAHRLGAYIAANPELQHSQYLAHLDGFWDLIVCSPDKPLSTEGREKLAIMRTLALFRQLGWDTSDGSNTQGTVLSVLKLLDPTMSTLRMLGSVEALRRKRVLQGQRTLFITPKLLHVAMWKGWCESYGKSVSIVAVRDSLADRMLDHFDAMLAYARESKVASGVVEELLGNGGPFATLLGFSSLNGPHLFFAVAQAKPKAALRRLKLALEAETVERRKEFSGEGRRSVIHGLEQLAVPSETFFEATSCLLLLAESENESWSNNATGVFVSMFGLGHGKIAASEMPPIDKISYLRDLLKDPLAPRRQLAIRALRESLSPYLSRMEIEETLGLVRLPSRWMPVTYDDIYDAYGAHVALLEESLDFLPSNEADEAARAILHHVRSLMLIPMLSSKLVVILRRISGMGSLRAEAIESVIAILHYEGKTLSPEVRLALEQLKFELTETSFSSKLRRYAGMKLLEDEFDADGNYTDEPATGLVNLVLEVCATPTLLLPEFQWLLSEEAKNGFHFGHALGTADTEQRLWSMILDGWIANGNGRSDYFIGGYLNATHSANPDLWERRVFDLFQVKEIRNSLLQVIWRSGMNAKVAKALLDLACEGEIDPRSFRLFVYGGAVSRMPLYVVEGVLELLSNLHDTSASDAALEILVARLQGAPQETEQLSYQLERVLDAPSFIEGSSERSSPESMTNYRWNLGATRLLKSDPARAMRIAVRCIQNFGHEGSVTSGYFAESVKFLDNAIVEHPDVLWRAISQKLEGKLDAGGWRMLQWLRGNNSSLRQHKGPLALESIPVESVFQWIDANIEERAWLLAEYCPPHVSASSQAPTIARHLLERYGSSQRVRDSLHANAFTGTWSGPTSEHYREKLRQVNEVARSEKNPNVRSWLHEQVERLEEYIARETAREELD